MKFECKPQKEIASLQHATAALQHCWFDAEAVSLKAGTARQSSNVATRWNVGQHITPQRQKYNEPRG
jgi:hypothetical protein